MKIPAILILLVLCFPLETQANPFEVLVVDTADAGNHAKIEEYRKDAAQFNSLLHKGYFSAKPYFNVLPMANGQVYFVFGFKDQVQGIHREDYPGTVKNLQKLKNAGARKYPDMDWIPVAQLRRLLATGTESGSAQGN